GVEHVLHDELMQGKLVTDHRQRLLADRTQIEPQRVGRISQILGDVLDRESLAVQLALSVTPSPDRAPSDHASTDHAPSVGAHTLVASRAATRPTGNPPDQ